MSELVQNLQKIYNTKLSLKDVLETDSDIFEDYPDIAAAKIAQGGGSGSSVDPWYEGKSTADMVEQGLSSADYVYANLAENFSVTTDPNDDAIIEAVEWDFYVDVPTGELDQDDNQIFDKKKIHVIVSSNDEHGELGGATEIETALKDYSDLYNNISPVLENATLTASEDPSGDGYDYLLEGDIYAWNLNNNCSQVSEITENGFVPNNGALGFDVDVPIPTIASKVASITANGRYNAQSVDSVDGWSEVTVNVPSSGITPTGKFSNFILKGNDGTVDCLYPAQNNSNTYADIAGDAKLYNIILEYIDAGVDAYNYTEYYFTDSTGTKLSYQDCYPCFDDNHINVSNAVIHTGSNFNFIAGTKVNLYAVFHSVIQDPNWSPDPNMPDEVPPVIDTPSTPYQLYLGGEPDIPCVIDGENYYVIYGNNMPLYYNGYLVGYLDDGTVTP